VLLGRCAYCDHSLGGNNPAETRALADATHAYSMQVFDRHHPRAGQRMAAMDRAERPRPSATARELAKPHPWEGDLE